MPSRSMRRTASYSSTVIMTGCVTSGGVCPNPGTGPKLRFSGRQQTFAIFWVLACNPRWGRPVCLGGVVCADGPCSFMCGHFSCYCPCRHCPPQCPRRSCWPGWWGPCHGPCPCPGACQNPCLVPCLGPCLGPCPLLAVHATVASPVVFAFARCGSSSPGPYPGPYPVQSPVLMPAPDRQQRPCRVQLRYPCSCIGPCRAQSANPCLAALCD